MTWKKILEKLACACFVLMWIPLAVFILHDSSKDVTDSDLNWMIAFLVLLFSCVILITVSTLAPQIANWRETRAVRRQGTLVPAVIRSIADTGIYINSQPVLELAITVHPPHEPAFEATVREVIPFSAIPQVQPGQPLQVFYIPGTTRVAMPE